MKNFILLQVVDIVRSIVICQIEFSTKLGINAPCMGNMINTYTLVFEHMNRREKVEVQDLGERIMLK
jgi:hypothetical protein